MTAENQKYIYNMNWRTQEATKLFKIIVKKLLADTKKKKQKLKNSIFWKKKIKKVQRIHGF
jgi:hypothetical protein